MLLRTTSSWAADQRVRRAVPRGRRPVLLAAGRRGACGRPPAGAGRARRAAAACKVALPGLDDLGELVVAAGEGDGLFGRLGPSRWPAGPSRGAAPRAGASGCGPWRWRCRRPAGSGRRERRSGPSSAVTSSSRSSFSSGPWCASRRGRTPGAPHGASTRAESAASSLFVLVPRSSSESVGSSVRPARYLSAELTSGRRPWRRSCPGRSAPREVARAASERTRARRCAAAASSSRCFASASEDVVVSVGRPVDRVDDGLGAARHVQRREQQDRGWRQPAGRRCPVRPGRTRRHRAGRHLLGQLLGEGVEFGDRLRVRVVRLESGALAGERRSAQRATASRSSRREAGVSVSARSSSTCRSTRALRCSEGALTRGDRRRCTG